MGKQIKDERVDDLMDMVKSFDFTYLIQDDLVKWKQGVNKEYLVKKLIHEVLEVYGFDNWKKLEAAVLKKTPQFLFHNIEHETIHNWFLPYNKPAETKNAPSAYKFQNHQSLKHGATNRMS